MVSPVHPVPSHPTAMTPPPMPTAHPNATPPPTARPGLFAGLRIRKKIIVLHTLFSLVLAGILLAALRPATRDIVLRAERAEAATLLRQLANPALLPPQQRSAEALQALADQLAPPGATLRVGTAESLRLADSLAARATNEPGAPINFTPAANPQAPPTPGVVIALDTSATPKRPPLFATATVRIDSARAAVTRLYILTVIALITVYGLVALALEAFVLPRHVYEPINRMLAADAAAQAGNTTAELIPDAHIPADELGAIMRSRNQTVSALRDHESALAEALARIEHAAADLKRKNHLLERARQNIAESDRLASLGLVSAGIAHELNTPLAVLKGLAERLSENPQRQLSNPDAALMLRVIARLERLGDSLLDMARARPPHTEDADLHALVEEAITLVRLDRAADGIDLFNQLPTPCTLRCDPDRILQVIVNITRNAVDAITHAPESVGTGSPVGTVTIAASRIHRDRQQWLQLRITDTGPGIPAEILPNLFEPFASSHLDARGTGLGLAVAEGIVKEHNGVILASNNSASNNTAANNPSSDNTSPARGATFEILLPEHQPSPIDGYPLP